MITQSGQTGIKPTEDDMTAPTKIVGTLRMWRWVGDREAFSGFVYGHAWITDGTQVTFPVKSVSECGTSFIVKTPYTEIGCGYHLCAEDELDLKEG